MASFMEFVDENKALSEVAKLVAGFVDGDNTIVEQSQALVKDKKFADFFNLIVDQTDAIIAKGSQKDIDAVYTVLVAIILKKTKEAVAVEHLRNLLAKISSSHENSGARMKVLVNVLNSLNHKLPVHFDTFMTVLQYALDTKKPGRVMRYSNDIDTLLNQWQIDSKSEKARQVYRVISEILRFSTPEGRNRIAHQYHLKYLSTFTSPDQIDEAVTQEAVKAATDAIRIPDVYQCDDLLQLAPVAALRQHAQYANLFALLSIVSEGMLNDYLVFYEKNKDTISSLGVTHEEIVDKMRVLTLCTIGHNKDSVSYKQVAESLKVSEDDVEEWIVRAAGLNLLDAQMDQINNVVTFTRSTQRVFTKNEWQQLGDKLADWKEGINSLLQVIQSGKRGTR